MIQCDACESWYHAKCVQVSQEDAEKQSFVCPECQRTEREYRTMLGEH